MPTCHACGAPLEAAARFCSQCGAAVQVSLPESGAQAATPPPEGQAAAPGAGAGPAGSLGTGFGPERNWAVFAHLSALAPVLLSLPLPFIGPLVMWLLANERGEYARDQAVEALNFNLSWLLWGVLLVIVGAILAVPTLLIGLIPVGVLAVALVVAWLVLVIVAAVRASAGERYRYPLTIRFVSAAR